MYVIELMLLRTRIVIFEEMKISLIQTCEVEWFYIFLFLAKWTVYKDIRISVLGYFRAVRNERIGITLHTILSIWYDIFVIL